jgi:hypothetical protein
MSWMVWFQRVRSRVRLQESVQASTLGIRFHPG